MHNTDDEYSRIQGSSRAQDDGQALLQVREKSDGGIRLGLATRCLPRARDLWSEVELSNGIRGEVVDIV